MERPGGAGKENGQTDLFSTCPPQCRRLKYFQTSSK